MYLGDLLTTADIRQAHHNLTVEPPRPQQRGIKYVWTVGRRDDDDAIVAFEPVHLDQQLVEGLFTLVVPAA